MSVPNKITTAVRLPIALLAAATLAACAGGNKIAGEAQPAAASSQAAAPAPETASPAPEPATPRRPPAGGRGQTVYVPPPPPEPAVTVEWARGQCWMDTEKSRFARDLDKRLKLIDDCVKVKMKDAGQAQ